MLLCTLITCKHDSPATPAQPQSSAEADSSDFPPDLEVQIAPDGPQTNDRWKYRVVYVKGGKTARFGVEFLVTGTRDEPIHMRAGNGNFIAIDGSDATILLSDLKAALAATQDPPHDIHVKKLPFQFVFLGENMDYDKERGPIHTVNGTWVAAKLFLGSQQESEVYFNFQRPGGKAVFSIKDPDYGNDLLRELAKVL